MTFAGKQLAFWVLIEICIWQHQMDLSFFSVFSYGPLKELLALLFKISGQCDVGLNEVLSWTHLRYVLLSAMLCFFRNSLSLTLVWVYLHDSNDISSTKKSLLPANYTLTALPFPEVCVGEGCWDELLASGVLPPRLHPYPKLYLLPQDIFGFFFLSLQHSHLWFFLSVLQLHITFKSAIYGHLPYVG